MDCQQGSRWGWCDAPECNVATEYNVTPECNVALEVYGWGVHA